MSAHESNARIKLPNKGQEVTVSSRRRETPPGSGDDSTRVISEFNWHTFANCRGYPVSMWFTRRTDPRSIMKEAKAICADCPVKRRCLNVALWQPDDDFGIFGGVPPKERRKIRAMIDSDPNYLETPEAIERYGLHGAY